MRAKIRAAQRDRKVREDETGVRQAEQVIGRDTDQQWINKF